MDIDTLKYALRHKRTAATGKSRDWTDVGVITTVVNGQSKTRERTVERQSRQGVDLTPSPLIETPNRYHNKKRCSCPEHVGDKWVNRSRFSADKRMTDGLHAYCKDCRNRQARFAYVPRWKRGV